MAYDKNIELNERWNLCDVFIRVVCLHSDKYSEDEHCSVSPLLSKQRIIQLEGDLSGNTPTL